MLLKDISLKTPEENILYDEVLLSLAERRGSEDTLRFWESKTYFIVLGRSSSREDDVVAEMVGRDGVPVLRRASGGGTVLQGPGCLNYSLVLSKTRSSHLADLHRSYQVICAQVLGVLERLNIRASFFPVSDLVLTETRKKFSGNAQKRGKNYILHHGTILYDFDLTLIERYLREPKDAPPYRGQRPHRDFLTNIPVDSAGLKEGFQQYFAISGRVAIMTDEERRELSRLSSDRGVSRCLPCLA